MSNDGATFKLSGAAPLLSMPALSSVVTSMADIALVLSPDGIVTSAIAKPDHPAFAEISGWPGQALADLCDAASAPKIADRLASLAARAAEGEIAPQRWAEVTHDFETVRSTSVRYALHWMNESGEVLALGLDQRPIIEIQQQLLNAQIALERDYEAQREIDTRYRLLMDFTSDCVVLVSMSTGRIVDINHHAAQLLGGSRADLIDTGFAEKFAGRRREDLLAGLASAMPADSPAPLEVEVRATQRRLLLTAKMFRAAGEPLVLVRMDDPETGSLADSQLTANLRQLFHRGVDAIVFCNKDGVVVSASETFLNLTDAPGLPAVRGRSIGDFFARGTVDLKVVLDNARRAGQLRMYQTRLKTDFDAQLPVEISATWLDDRVDPVLALVIRNATNTAALRADPAMPEAGMRGVMELVGSSTLKDIVAETTNVIEKICIETAIELTRNNRVAAAEMLGLSRQSLYVKLRKYGMLSRDEE
ncbi:MAG: transcriptional regulator PpsR [Roseinatronobacter sp.]